VIRFQERPGLSGLLGLFTVLCGLGQTGCGRKGPPLAPIVYVPRAVTELSAKRTEDEAVLRFTLPTVNTDNSNPANLRRIEVYAHTGPLPSTADYLRYGTLIASINVKEPETAKTDETGTTGARGEENGDPKSSEEPLATEKPAADGAPVQTATQSQSVLLEQGWTTTVRETLTEKTREIGPMPPTRPPPAAAASVHVETLETPGTVNFDLPPTRYYTVVGVSRNRNRRGPFAGPIRVPLVEPSNAPEHVEIKYTADAIALVWPKRPEDVTPAAPVAPIPATGGIARLETEDTVDLYTDVETEGTQNPPAAPAPPLTRKPPPPPVARFGYNVYEVNGSSGEAGATEPAAAKPTEESAAKTLTARVAPPVPPLNPTLLTTSTFSDPRVEFGAERCYVVRRVEMAGTIAIESAPSPPACVTPVDTFPPAPPKNLAHIASGGGVSLLWEANSESDLGGYLVLRGEAPGDRLSPLTPVPITNTSFTDTTVRRGRTYVYEVVALDKSTPANQSAPSNRVEETIR
jgi:hypothetical protein